MWLEQWKDIELKKLSAPDSQNLKLTKLAKFIL